MSGGGAYNVEKEISHLVHEFKRIGDKQADGTYTTTFIKIFKDDIVQNTLESLVGTLKAAKKRKIVDFKGEMLLQGAHDNVVITLLQPDFTA